MAAEASGVRYRAFISYSHQDEAWARWLHRAIETYRIPSRLVGQATAAGPIPRRLAPVFRDRDELPSATDLGSRINDALARSDALVVICSPHSATSRWVDEEVLAFKRLGRERVFCLIVAGEPNASAIPGRETDECFCPALRFAMGSDGQPTREPAEPIAADARPGGDGKSNGRLKVIAGMLDVGFDVLKQREQHRRVRKWAALAAASFAGMLLAGSLSVYALRARSEAIAQRGEAEGLIEFMIGDLRKKLEPVGRLDVLDSVGERALAYYSKQDTRTLDADSLGRRARALHLIGEVDDLRGNLDHALDVFQKAARSTSELLERAPDDPQRIFDHAQSVYWVGAIAFQRGQNDVAEKSFNDYRTLAERLVALDPDKPDWKAEVGYAYSNLGTLLIKEGRAAEAVKAFERSLAVSSDLARLAPDDVGKQLDDAQSYAWLADANEKLGDFAAARRGRDAELAIYQAVLASDPANTDAKRSLLVARYALARLSMARGDVGAAIDQLKSAVTLADELMRTEPDSTQWADMSAQAYAYLGEALMFGSGKRAAKAEIDRACAIATDLVRRDSSVVRWRGFLLSRCDLLEAAFAAQSGDHETALRLARQVTQRIDALGEKEKQDQLIRTQLGLSLLASGDQCAALGRSTEATADWQRAVAELQPEADREDASTRTVLATALSRIGRTSDAATLAAGLDGIGYRHPKFLELKALLAESSKAAAAGT